MSEDQEGKELQRLRAFGISQIGAAEDVHKAIGELGVAHLDPSLIAVAETDIYRLRRGLCLPSAAASCVNFALGRRVIGERPGEAPLTIGDFFRVLLPRHNKPELAAADGTKYPHPWFVVTPEGDMYHQSVMAVAEGLGVHTASIANFEDPAVLEPLLRAGGAVAISLDNRFVIEQTLRNDPHLVRELGGEKHILIEGPSGTEFRKFEQGRHVVSIMGIEPDGTVIVHDSFQLPQMQGAPYLRMSLADIAPYLKYAVAGGTRAIAFAKDEESLSSLESYRRPVFIPAEVVDEVKTKAGVNAIQSQLSLLSSRT